MNLETKRLSLDALRAETDRHQGNADYCDSRRLHGDVTSEGSGLVDAAVSPASGVSMVNER